MKNYDLIVVGGGLTGVAAAVAAAKEGSSVLILESAGFLGGAASTMLVYPFMPNSTLVTNESGEKKMVELSRGVYGEIAPKLLKPGYNTSLIDEDLKVLLDNMTQEHGVDVLFHANLAAVKKESNHIISVSVTTKAGILEFYGRYFIDATGDADLSAMAKVPTQLGRAKDNLCQPMTLCFRVANIDTDKFWMNAKTMQDLYQEWVANGKITNPRENILAFGYPIDGMIHFNTTRIVKLNPVDPFDLTKAEMEARRQVVELMNFFREANLPGFEKAQLVYTAPSIGVRESRMLIGDYVLTGKDLVDCTKFEDAIAAGNYDIDIHNPEGTGTSHYYFPQGQWYTIPYRSLTPKSADAENLLVGGRCISADHEAQASIRIMPICCTTGEAAGIAAAIAAKENIAVQKVNIETLQTTIINHGGFIG